MQWVRAACFDARTLKGHQSVEAEPNDKRPRRPRQRHPPYVSVRPTVCCRKVCCKHGSLRVATEAVGMRQQALQVDIELERAQCRLVRLGA